MSTNPPRLYLDDALIIINHAAIHAERLTPRAAYLYFMTRVYQTIQNDREYYRTKLDRQDASTCLLQLYAHVLKQFEAEFSARLKRLDQLRTPSVESVSTIVLSQASAKPIPYSEKLILPPLVASPARQGPKPKTRGTPVPIILPAPVALDIGRPPPPRSVPKTVYHVLQRIFLPREKGKLSFDDLKHIMTCKELGFTYKPAKGSGRRFAPPIGSGLKTYTPHQCVSVPISERDFNSRHRPHGGNELKPNIVRRDLNKLYGWTMDSFIPKDGKHAE
ncbi:hypothetical protein C8R47DRAFT_433219 [Mycena vitilis]|nr:hypothetical protein C8R47DRAFT_433219 [Mycena vitilis]